MQERDAGKRRQVLTELQRKAADKKLAEEYLLDTSMISGLREAARIE
jgi:3-(3-hydroxy-phenyl)propionate hydroxylase